MYNRQITQPPKGEPRRLSPNKSNLSYTIKDPKQLHRIIINLKIMGLSLAEIQVHLERCHFITLSIRKIKQILLESGDKARKMNAFYDSKVLHRIKIGEADEIYQGQEGMFMGIADKNTNYLVCLKQVSDKNTEVFAEVFRNLKDKLPNIKCWITDGLTTYNPALDGVFSEVLHIICHVHIYREQMNELDLYNRKARRAYNNIKEVRNDMRKIRQHLVNNRKTVESYRNILCQTELLRDTFYQAHGLKKYSKTRKFMKERLTFRDQMENIRAYIRSYEKQVQLWEKKSISKRKELKPLHLEFIKQKNVALQSGRIVAKFKQLLDWIGPGFDGARENFIDQLKHSLYPIAAKIIKILKNKPKIFNDKIPVIQAIIAPNFANTNTIESIFGRYRLFFKKYRNMTNSKYGQAIFEILRLHHNLTAPLHGPNKEFSPIQRANIGTKFTNCLDCLCAS